MMRHFRNLLSAATVAFLLPFLPGAPSQANAGLAALFPPGPPAATMKRLDQVSPAKCIEELPHVISEPGVYELCGNLSGTSGEHGILVAAPDVTIDFKGYTIRGVPGSLDGVHVLSGSEGFRLTGHGTATEWGGSGLHYTGTVTKDRKQMLEWYKASNNGGAGVHFVIQEPGGRIGMQGVTATGNGSHGILIEIQAGGAVTKSGVDVHTDIDAVAGETSGNEGDGIRIDSSSPGVRARVRDSRSNGNTGSGAHIQEAGPGELGIDVSDSEFHGNGENGVRAHTYVGGRIAAEALRAQNNAGAGVLCDGFGEHSLHGVHSGRNGGPGLSLQFPGEVIHESPGAEWVPRLEIRNSSAVSNIGDGLVIGGPSVTIQRRMDLHNFSSRSNGGAGVRYSTASSCGRFSIHDSGLIGNGEEGLVWTSNPELSSCVLFFGTELGHNGSDGARIQGSATVSLDRTTAKGNGGHGIHAIFLAGDINEDYRKFDGFRAQFRDNGGDGIRIEGLETPDLRTTLSGTISGNNEGAGMRLTGGAGDSGRLSVADSAFERNAAEGLLLTDGGNYRLHRVNAAANGGDGFRLRPTCGLHVAECQSSKNTGNGIALVAAPGEYFTGTVAGNVASGNGLDGLSVNGGGLDIADNVLRGHRGTGGEVVAGIRVLTPGSRLHGNMLVDNDVGVALYANENPVYGNTFQANTDPAFENGVDGVAGNLSGLFPISDAPNSLANILH